MHMMKRITLVLLAVVFSATAAASSKVVVFNMQAAILQTDVAKKRLSALEADAEYAALRGKFESLRAELEALQKDAEKNGMVWTQEQQAAHRKKVEYKSADFKLAVEKLKAERNAVMQQIMQEQGEKAKAVLKELVTAESVGLVLDSSVAYWADAEHDITAKVTAKLNALR